MSQSVPLSIVIPTFGREEVLVQTIEHLLRLETRPEEILVVDQTPEHTPETTAALQEWDRLGTIRWIRLPQPSITGAMNVALKAARSPLVLFLDDDIVPTDDLVKEHLLAHQEDDSRWATVGQVIQPWQTPEACTAPRRLTGLRVDFDFPFHSTIDHDVQNVMAGNLCVNRERVLSIGGFDENFHGAAHRFETEFAYRVIRAGGKIRFLGSAGIRHLQVPAGGTRSKGSHLTVGARHFAIGDYYYAFRHGGSVERWVYTTRRVFREVCTKFHLTHPWWIPVKLLGELQAMSDGWNLARRQSQQDRSSSQFPAGAPRLPSETR